MTKQADEIAELKQQMADQKAELEALKAAQAKANPPKSTFVPISNAEWRDQMHALAEKRMSMATPPSVVRDWAVIPEHIVKGIREDRHAPTGPSSAGASGQVTKVSRDPGLPGSGWSAPTPLSNPPGVAQADRLMDAQDRRDRIELAQRIAAHEAAMRAAQKERG